MKKILGTLIALSLLILAGCASGPLKVGQFQPLQILPDIQDCHGKMQMTVMASGSLAAVPGAQNSGQLVFSIECPPQGEQGFSFAHSRTSLQTVLPAPIPAEAPK
jgi:hypothetical protein